MAHSLRAPSARAHFLSAHFWRADFLRAPARAALALAATVTGSTVLASGRLPETASSDLNGQEVMLPRDLPGDPTLALVGFIQDHQFEIDTWIDGLKLKDGRIAWIELPVIRNYGAIFRWYVDNGMRSGISGQAARARVVTLYQDPVAFQRAVGLPDGERAYAVVLDRTGRVRAVAAGSFTPQKAEGILAALGGGAAK